MLAISFHLLAGRYHATPWGRHVNEADIAWPPEPWRIARALIATWHRKLDHDRYPRERLVALLTAMSSELPVYQLPTAVHAHTRHYMPLIESGKERKTLIFDAFARVHPDDPVITAWPHIELTSETTEMLDELLRVINYLGRAESWVEAKRLDTWAGKPDCYPGDEAVDENTGEFRDVIPLLIPKTPSEYLEFRNQTLAATQAQTPQAAGSRRRGRVSNPLEHTLPEDWLTAIARDTGDLQKAGWSAPPAADNVYYVRPHNALACQAQVLKQPPLRSALKKVTTARFALYGKPLPRIEDAVRVGECMRAAVLHHFGAQAIPAALSGHDLPKNNRHGHAFFLPEDADGDGEIDHMVIHVPDGLDTQSCSVLDRMTRLWVRDDVEWQLLLEGIAEAGAFAAESNLLAQSNVWQSTTPYLHPWFTKKKFTIEDQLRRESRERGLPEITHIEQQPTVRIAGRQRHPVHFHRFRNKRGLTQPDTRGSFWRITFMEPVQGPLALGFGCHFGLGVFGKGD